MTSPFLMATNKGADLSPPSDYEAFYPLDTDSLDSSANNYHGTDANMTYDGVAGVFNGSSSRIALPVSISNDNNIVAISTWVNTISTASLSVFTSRLGVLSDNVDFIIGVNYPAAGNIWFFSTSILLDVTLPTAINNGTYHHVVMNINRTTKDLQIYYDKSLVLNTNLAGIVKHVVDEFGLGSNAGANWWDGEISNTRVYNYELDLTEVTNIYNAELAEHS